MRKVWHQIFMFNLIFFISFSSANALTLAEELQLESTLFKDPTYHFQIMIPDITTYNKNFTGNYFFPANEWRIRGGKNGKPLVRIPYFVWGKPGSGGYYYVFEVRIGTSSNTTDLATCTQGYESTTKINDETFYVFHDSDVGMNQYFDVVSYRTIHHGQCFAIEQVHYASNSPIAKQLDKAQLQNGTQAIIQTFKFTKNE